MSRSYFCVIVLMPVVLGCEPLVPNDVEVKVEADPLDRKGSREQHREDAKRIAQLEKDLEAAQRGIITRTVYKWVRKGYGDIRKHDDGTCPQINGMPAPSACTAATVGRVAVCPNDNPSICHFKKASADKILAQDLTSWNSHPGGVFVCEECEEVVRSSDRR